MLNARQCRVARGVIRNSIARPLDASIKRALVMTARVPGRTEVVSGVRLVSHNVDVVLRDGVARTEVEEIFQNDTSQVLEGRYVFPLPADASISRLALWVNDKPVEGEIVEVYPRNGQPVEYGEKLFAIRLAA